MTDGKIFEALEQFLKDNVAAKIQFKKPPEDGNISTAFEYVNPAVYTGWVPPKNYLTEYGYDVPAIVIMNDGGQDDYSDAALDIRLGLVTYGPGEHKDGQLIPDVNGYKDILRLINLIRMELSKAAVIGGQTTIQKPIKWALYEEQNYPYWHGWMTFQASALIMDYQDDGINKNL